MSQKQTITAADVAVLKIPTPKDKLVSINIQLSELQKELQSENDCAAHHKKQADNSIANAKLVEEKIAALTAERDAIVIDAEEDGKKVA